MRLKEQRVWDTFRRHSGKTLDLLRVENVVSTGMPDVYSRKSGNWIELKAPIAPKRETTRVLGTEGLNIDQVNWHLKCAKGRVKSFVLIRDTKMRLWLIPGKHAQWLNEFTAKELDKHSVADNWDDINLELS